MTRLESMSLKQLFALRARLWSDPAVVSAEIEADFAGPAVEKFVRGNAIIARNLAAGPVKRIEALESRVEALETKH